MILVCKSCGHKKATKTLVVIEFITSMYAFIFRMVPQLMVENGTFGHTEVVRSGDPGNSPRAVWSTEVMSHCLVRKKHQVIFIENPWVLK